MNQKPHSVLRRAKLAAGGAVVASVAVHAVLMAALGTITFLIPKRPERLTDGPSMALTLAPPSALVAEPVLPAPSLPPPVPEPITDAAATAPIVVAPTAMTLPEPAKAAAPRVVLTPRPIPVAEPPPPAPPADLPASFAGVEAARARRIVYVVDGSAAMVPTFPYLKDELARSVARLDASQSFQVVVFRRPPGTGAQIVTFTSSDFEPATPAAKTRLGAWLETLSPAGQSVPLAGLTAGLAHGPDLVFLMTRSIPRSAAAEWGEGKDATLAALDRLNPVSRWTHQRPTVIKAIQLVNEDPTGLLPAVAAAHGDGPGSYRVLTLDEIK